MGNSSTVPSVLAHQLPGNANPSSRGTLSLETFLTCHSLHATDQRVLCNLDQTLGYLVVQVRRMNLSVLYSINCLNWQILFKKNLFEYLQWRLTSIRIEPSTTNHPTLPGIKVQTVQLDCTMCVQWPLIIVEVKSSCWDPTKTHIYSTLGIVLGTTPI